MGARAYVCMFRDVLTLSKSSFRELLAKRVGRGRQITTLAAGPPGRASVKIATGTRDLGVQVFTYSKDHQLQTVFSVLVDCVPIGITFLNTAADDICFLDHFHGDM